MREVKVGKIVITIDDPPSNAARIACDTASCDIGSAAGQRFFDELTKIREALKTAQKVLMHSALKGGAATTDEMHFLKLLVDLELVIYQDEIT